MSEIPSGGLGARGFGVVCLLHDVAWHGMVYSIQIYDIEDMKLRIGLNACAFFVGCMFSPFSVSCE
jgi:hypothetical protein